MNDARHDFFQKEDASDEYANRLRAERRAFEACPHVHDLPPIFHYWSNTYIRPKLAEAGYPSSNALFSRVFEKHCSQEEFARFLSIGSGNGDQEIGFASALRAAGHTRFVIDCVESNDAMQERGRISAAHMGVSDHIRFIIADFNDWEPSATYNAVIAIQSLHHVVNLEALFRRIRACLHGEFVISDIIGRNGHRRWPEALAIVQEFWRKLPPSYRFNRQLERYEETFQDWDCSREGFEGIRAQDILPLLAENFDFSLFLGFGNIVDPFLDRGFGHNFDVHSSWDRSFIDAVHARNELELRAGTVTPTHLYAIVAPQGQGRPGYTSPLDPRSCIRPPNREPLDIIDSGTDQNTYDWGAWPHPDRIELEFVCSKLAAAEASVARCRSEIEAARERFEALFLAWEERTTWALDLERELEAKRNWVTKLDQELSERTKWAVSLDEELRRRTEWAHRLEGELGQSTEWALALDAKLKERTEWALGLDRSLETAAARISALELELEAARHQPPPPFFQQLRLLLRRFWRR